MMKYAEQFSVSQLLATILIDKDLLFKPFLHEY